VPLLVGGSGLYLRAAQDGLAATPSPDAAIRARLLEEWDANGGAASHERLRREDPETAARLDPADRQRVVRALEVLESTGRPLSWWHRQPRVGAAPGPWCVIEVTLGVHALSERIERRARWMFAHGLIEETERIREQGRTAALRRLRAVGYDEALALLEGTLSREEAEAFTILRTRQLAKRQRTWFRHQARAVRLDGAEPPAVRLERALELARARF
jgi:tRNA dimethylallyltransferase